MFSCDYGRLGELKVAAYFTSLGYPVFTQVSGGSPYDLVVEINGELKRVEVKTTRTKSNSGKYVVQIKSVRINKGRNKINGFNNSKCDILAIYIIPKDKVILIDSKEIKSNSSLTV